MKSGRFSLGNWLLSGLMAVGLPVLSLAQTAQWVNVSGTTSQSGSVLILTGGATTAKAQVTNIAVTPGTQYTLTGQVMNSTGNSWTYIGVDNAGVVTEQGRNTTSYTAITPIVFTATGSTVSVYGSFWQGQTGTGYVENVALNGVAILSGSSGGGGGTGGGGGGTGNCAGTYTLCDDFNGTALNTSLWYFVQKNWGGQVSGSTSYNGGVLPANVSVSGGNLHLVGHGNLYTGPLLGINKDGSTRTDGTKVGAGIASLGYFGSGTYEVRMKVLPDFGAVSTMWTFNYQEFAPGTPEYIANNGTGDVWVSNHEIDVEMPGRPGAADTGISFNWALFNTWIGERDSPSEYTTGYTNTGINNADGNFHIYKFIWHTGSNPNHSDGSVQFYVYGVLNRTATGTAAHVPWKEGRLWLADWFANSWAGTANFDTAEMTVDYVRFTASNDPNDTVAAETYPCDGLVGCQ
jgi:hypothetical protein